MRYSAIVLGAAALTACGGADTSFKDPSQAAGTCGTIEMLNAARSDAEPFQSLRGDPVMMGENPVEDAFIMTGTAFNSTCEINAMRGFFGEPFDIHTLNCDLFNAGNFDKEENARLATAAFERVEANLSECLGDGWTQTEKDSDRDYEIYRKITYKRVDAQPTGAKFTSDPLYLELSYTPFLRGRGGKPGWQVTLQFQEQVAAPGG